ncbi:hypothetical protein L227DRAFT_540273 [Lentinus tigrinus ALCF2SS1-6]|uniref:Nitrate reductase [NADPH] n=2 Tax=Lentinus tigrinus TaxID=5365 RepID=A0A5C2SNZ2_9APHY|nr:hypothetical protein L227DRAFT_540273 [Lentinus tigrinus ALCF2SS1-6]
MLDSRVTSRLSAPHIATSHLGEISDAPAESHWRKILRSGDSLITVRDIKAASPNYKVKNRRNYDFARYVLPVAETDIKEQKYLSKQSSTDEKVVLTEAASLSSGSTLAPDIPSGGDKQDNGKNRLVNLDVISTEEAEFQARVLKEFCTIAEFKNNLGIPSGELKSLDGDALEQLESCLSIDDQNTPDSWIPRSPELLRLTGKHPLNAEPNQLRLFEAGLITPTKLHFVRNHAAVPQLNWETHTFSVYSDPPDILSKPRQFTMYELTSGAFKVIEIPVTMGCDGNRRKEVNMVKRTVGFNWTASGVSTALWRGVPVCDILLACRVRDTPPEERWYLNFEGADEPADGPYATAIPLSHAMNPANDVILAFGMNGRVLHPDHGYPVRVIIPGYVGGRQIKWLKKMWVSKQPNMSYYHIWDNKVLPSFIDSKNHPLAKTFFEDESTACWEQTLQSFICKPAHDERIMLLDASSYEKTYTVGGIAFNGGGERIERVELSLDGGKTWKYCFRHFLESPLRRVQYSNVWVRPSHSVCRHGDKYWAWIFWSCDVKVREMVDAFEIVVRAHDKKKNFQPEHITWNLTGMMNNAWYRVRSNVIHDPNTPVSILQFQHPVAPGEAAGGWMKPPADEAPQTNDSLSKLPTYSLEEIAKHDKTDDAWIILDNKVYDVTSVLSWHPGGAKSILMYAGKATVDVTIEYNAIHDNYAHMRRDEGLIGTLSKEGVEVMQADSLRAAEKLAELKAQRKGLALQPDVFVPAKLVRRKQVTADSSLYTFELPRHPNGTHGALGLPVGRHIQTALHFQDQAVFRSYTPVRPVLPSEEDGTFDLLVKTYMPLNGTVVSPGGTISNYLDCMEEGEEIDIRGPSGSITYKGRGEFDIDGKPFHFNKINLVSGGSGLTPHWQLIRTILSDPEDETQISLINSNKTYSDIWMRSALEGYAEEHPERFKIWNILSFAPSDKNLKHSVGRLAKAIMMEHFYPSGPGVGTFLCGPVGLIEDAAVPVLQELGFEDGRSIFAF